MHLTEEQVHAFLDGELAAAERAAVHVHLSTCGQCREELASLRRLFIALDELVPAPDLVPALRARLACRAPARSKQAWRRWISLGIEAAAAVVLLAWMATRPADYWAGLIGTWPVDLRAQFSGWWAGAFGTMVSWLAARWAEAPSWPAAVWSVLQGWLPSLPSLGQRLTLPQWALWIGALVIMGLVGNALLLRRAALNGRAQ